MSITRCFNNAHCSFFGKLPIDVSLTEKAKAAVGTCIYQGVISWSTGWVGFSRFLLQELCRLGRVFVDTPVLRLVDEKCLCSLFLPSPRLLILCRDVRWFLISSSKCFMSVHEIQAVGLFGAHKKDLNSPIFRRHLLKLLYSCLVNCIRTHTRSEYSKP